MATTTTKARRRKAGTAVALGSGTALASFRAKIRMYRGLGDCLLVTLPRAGGNYFILIDCGILLGTPNAKQWMTDVVEDIVATTEGKVDLLLATHEHWDHLSGFVQAADAFKKLTVGEVWMAWTEDPADALARKLRGEREAALTALRLTAARLRLAADAGTAGAIEGLLEFFGAGKGASTRDALEVVRGMTARPRYCRPKDPPVALASGARLYVLGPPEDEKLIKKTRPSKRNPETYGLALELDDFRANVEATLGRQEPEAPFSTLHAIPTPVAQEMDFFKAHYWGGNLWRRIDSAWLEGSTEFALQLDSATNNTSLVLAIELADGDVLLFAADAQVGNWLSWQDLAWSVDGQTVKGPDLLKRTVLYKVGHHGSHNATLRENGLEMMNNLSFALVPVDKKIADDKGWHEMPLQELIEALEKKAKGCVVQSDEGLPAAIAGKAHETKLYVEVTM
jgi:hypothetical protein